MVTRKNLNNDLRAVLLVLICLAINFILGKIASLTSIPFYFDCIGTIAAAILGGFMPGVLVGFFTNLLSSISDSSNLYYGVLNVLIALVAAGF